MEDFFLPQDENNQQSNHVCGVLTPFTQLKRAYSDQMGRFPYKSSRGKEYLLILYDYDRNAILCEAIKSKAAAIIRDGWQKYIRN